MTLSSANVVMTPANRSALQIIAWPDLPIGAYSTDSGNYTFISSGYINGGYSGAATPCSVGGHSLDVGTYQFSGSISQGTLTISQAAQTCAGGVPLPSLVSGSITPPPGQTTATAFDQSYAGGSEVYMTTVNGSPAWIMIYHGEIDWAATDGSGRELGCQGLGLAVSTNNGASFQKLGQIYQPFVTFQTVKTTPLPGTPGWVGFTASSDFGSFVFADAGGHYVSNPEADPSNTYLYLLNTDYNDGSIGVSSPCSPSASTGIGACFALSRAKVSDLKAAVAGTASAGSIFFKYYNGTFSEPAVGNAGSPATTTNGGLYTPIFLESNVGGPNLIYDSYLGQYLLIYNSQNTPTTGLQAFSVRTSTDLINWSAPIVINPPVASALSGHVNNLYAALIGENGDPRTGVSSPILVWLQGPWTQWPSMYLVSGSLALTAH